MFEPQPEPDERDYLNPIKDGETHRIRIIGANENPETFIQAWQVFDAESNPHRAQFEQGKPCPKDLKEIANKEGDLPKVVWIFTIFHVDWGRAMIWNIHQKTIKEPILAYSKNAAWGDPRNYILEIKRTGSGQFDTEYKITALPPIEPPDQKILAVMNEAAIDVRACLTDSNPFGALTSADDQEDIQRKSQSVKFESDGGGINKPVSAMDVLGRMRDNAPPAPDEETAPPMEDGQPY